MQLLDLPPEIFQQIMHELVSVAGPCSAWKSRSVCRTFAAEIHYDVFTKNSAQSLRSTGASRIIKSGIPLFLANRTKLPLGECPDLPDLIKGIVEYFSRKLKATTYAQRELLLKTICECVDRSMRTSDVLNLLVGNQNRTQTVLRHTSKNRERITIAAALGRLSLVQKWLPGITKRKYRYEEFSTIFGHPLVNAAAYGHRNIVKYLIGTGRHFLFWTKDNATKLNYMNGYLSRVDVLSAAKLALSRRDLGMTRSLFEFRPRKFHTKMAKSDYNWCLDSALKTGDIRFVEIIKPRHPRYGSNVTVGQFNKACKGGNVDIVKALLGEDGMRPDSTFSTTTPLVAAVRSGHLDVVAAVLEAGAPPNGKPKKSNTPLHIASSGGKEAMVRMLLENGARVGDMELHTKSEATYELLRQAKMEEDGVEVPSYTTALKDKKNAATIKTQEKAAAKRKAQQASDEKFGTEHPA